MNALPECWETANLRDVTTDISYGFTTSSVLNGSGPKLLRITDIQNGNVDWCVVPHCVDTPRSSFLLQAGDIVIARTGATTGKSFLIEKLACSTAFASYLIRTRFAEDVEPKYAWAFMQTEDYWSQIQVVSKGTAQPGANAQLLSQLRFPIAPLNEQRRIVAKIDSLSAKSKRARDHLDHIPRLVEKYKQAILAAAFRGVLTHDEQHGFDRLPLGTLAKLITKGASPKWQGFQYVENGTLFVRSQNVGWGDLLLEDRAYLPPEFEAKHQRSIIHGGDVLLNIVGASIGRAAVATSELEGANCNQAVSIIRLLENEASSDFLCYWLLGEEAQSAIAFGTVDFARANFSLGDIRNLQVPWPKAEKRGEIIQRIRTAFAWIDRLASEATSARKLIDHLDQAVLAKAFRGELVPQDPNDEPASVLLERINAERSAALTATRKRRQSA